MELDENRERPLECSSCTRPLTTKYTEVHDKIVNQYYLCSECPCLQEFLYKPKIFSDQESKTHLTCGHCKTSLLDVQRGELMGCSGCYDIFEGQLLSSLKKEERILMNLDLQGPLHLGHSPGEFKEFGESQRIFALNETLNEMIHREDYEQAASIRDQINDLKKREKKYD